MSAIYVHFPFCRSRCAYCAFYSQTDYSLAEAYVNALKAEMRQRANYLDGQTVGTIYFGGGTPSSLPIGSLEAVATAIRETFDCKIEEFTVELNPDDVTPRLLDSIRKAGATRISMGIQTFDDHRLRLIHRRHTAQQAIDAYQMIHQWGFSNVSIDLILALPGQTLEGSAADIDAAIGLHPDHISAYLLEYEASTPLYRMLSEGKIRQTDDSVQADMYYQMVEKLTYAGYEHYEISNFARIDKVQGAMRSRHNSSYWDNTPYIGLGAAAHSFNNVSRQWNTANISEYIRSTLQGQPAHETEQLDATTRYNEMVMTRLRTAEGIRPSDRANLPQEFCQYLDKAAGQLLCDKLLELTPDGRLKLTHCALMVSDMVMSQLFAISDN